MKQKDVDDMMAEWPKWLQRFCKKNHIRFELIFRNENNIIKDNNTEDLNNLSELHHKCIKHLNKCENVYQTRMVLDYYLKRFNYALLKQFDPEADFIFND